MEDQPIYLTEIHLLISKENLEARSAGEWQVLYGRANVEVKLSARTYAESQKSRSLSLLSSQNRDVENATCGNEKCHCSNVIAWILLDHFYLGNFFLAPNPAMLGFFSSTNYCCRL